MGVPPRGPSTPTVDGQPIVQKTPQGLHILTTDQLRGLTRPALAIVVRELVLSEAGLIAEERLTRQQQVEQNKLQKRELEPILIELAFQYVEEVIGATGKFQTVKLVNCWWDIKGNTYIVGVLVDPDKSGFMNPEELNEIPLTYSSQRQTNNREAHFSVALSDFLPLPSRLPLPTSISRFEEGAATYSDSELNRQIKSTSTEVRDLNQRLEVLLGLARARVFASFSESLRTLCKGANCRLSSIQCNPEQAQIDVYIPESSEVEMLIRRLQALFPGIHIGTGDNKIKCHIPINNVLT